MHTAKFVKANYPQTPFIHNLEKAHVDGWRGTDEMRWCWSTALQIILSNTTRSIHSTLQNGLSKNIYICNTLPFYFTVYVMYIAIKSTVHAHGKWIKFARSSEKLQQWRTATNSCYSWGENRHRKALCNVSCFSHPFMSYETVKHRKCIFIVGMALEPYLFCSCLKWFKLFEGIGRQTADGTLNYWFV